MIRGALIGFGFISEKGHLPAYLASANDFGIVAVADISEGRREAARRLLPGARVYPDAESLLVAEADHLDFVDIATPPCDHATITHAALARGLHVFCEKPLATLGRDARAMVGHASEAGRVLMPAHNYKHAPVIRALGEIIHSGCIGAVHLVTLDTFRTTHARGAPEWLPDWRRSRRYSGGGILLDHGAHSLYLTFDWLRSYPTAITAKVSHQGAHDTEDNATCAVSFPNGAAIIHLSWTAGARRVQYTLHGERGAVFVDDDDLRIEVHGRPTERRSVSSSWTDASHCCWFRPLLASFGRAIREGGSAGSEAREAMLCVEIIEAAYSSSRGACREMPLGLEATASAAP